MIYWYGSWLGGMYCSGGLFQIVNEGRMEREVGIPSCLGSHRIHFRREKEKKEVSWRWTGL